MVRGAQGGHYSGLILASSSVPLSRRAVRTMIQEENHPQLMGPPAASGAPRPSTNTCPPAGQCPFGATYY
ncbi:hypothetical protein MRX96_022630 [Rhipicephalus microplus]